jgi:hypothetical protein
MKEYNSYLTSFAEVEEEKNIPKLQIFRSCPVLVEAIKACSYDKKKVEDIAAFEGDDPVDGLRYMVDAAENYMATAEKEFEIVQKREAIIQRLHANQDYTGFYRDMRGLEAKKDKPVRLFHRRRLVN